MTRQDVTADWYWEGNVVDAIARELTAQGWQIVARADTHTRQQGVDLHAKRDGLDLLIEAKGYPSDTYRDPLRAAEKKRTTPPNQAQHWYSHALLKIVRLQTAHPEALVAMAFPDFPRYRSLFEETKAGLSKLGAGLITVDRGGRITVWGLPWSN